MHQQINVPLLIQLIFLGIVTEGAYLYVFNTLRDKNDNF